MCPANETADCDLNANYFAVVLLIPRSVILDHIAIVVLPMIWDTLLSLFTAVVHIIGKNVLLLHVLTD